MNTLRTRLSFSRVTLLVTVLAATAPTNAEPWVAEWAPGDALVFVGIPNCDELVDAAKKLSAYKMLQEPALKDEVQPFVKVLENAREMLAKELGLDSAKELEIYPHGAVALTISATLPTGDDDEPTAHLAAIMDMGEDADNARKLVKKAIARCVEKGATKAVARASGQDVTTMKFRESDTEEGAGTSLSESLLKGVEIDEMTRMGASQFLDQMEMPKEFAVAFSPCADAGVETCLIIGSDKEAVTAALRQLKRGKEKSLAAAPAGRSLKKKCDAEAHLQIVLNIPAFIEMLGAAEPDSRRYISAAGLQAIGAFVMSIEFSPKGNIDSRVRGFMHVAPDRTGVAKLLMMDNANTVPPSTVPADAIFYGSINLDFSAIMEEAIAIATRIDEAEGEQMRAGMKVPQPDGSVLDLKADIIDKVVGPLSVTVSGAMPFKTDDVNLLVSLGHKSREAMTKLIGLFPPGMLMPTDMMGSTVCETPMLPGAALGITDQVLIPIATKKAVEAYIRSAGKVDRGLSDDAEFRKIAKRVPKKSCAMAYGNAVRMLEAQMAILESGDIDPANPPMFGTSLGDMLRWWIASQAVSKDPDNAEMFRKYQTNSIMTMATESNGLRFDTVSVRARTKK